MTLTRPEELKIKRLLYQYRYIFGRKQDRRFKYPQGLEDIYIIRYNNPDNPLSPLNGKIGLLIAYTSTDDEPVLLFEMNWIESKREYLTYIRRLTENDLPLEDEWKERLIIHKKFEPITDNDIMDLYNELRFIEEGIIINKDLL